MLVTQSCPTLCDPMDCSPPGSSVHGILQARILEWVACPFSKGSSQPRDRTCISRIAGRFFTIWATREAPDKGKSWETESQPDCHRHEGSTGVKKERQGQSVLRFQALLLLNLLILKMCWGSLVNYIWLYKLSKYILSFLFVPKYHFNKVI